MIRRAYTLAWPRVRAAAASCWSFALLCRSVWLEGRGPSRLEAWWRSIGRPMRANVDERGRVTAVAYVEGI